MNIYYGNGICETDDFVTTIMIVYRGAIIIDNMNPEDCVISSSVNRILIMRNFYKIKPPKKIKELFKYEGEFKILSAEAINISNEKINLTIKRVMDYSEMLGVSESITVNSEDLSAGYVSGRRISKTILKQPIVNDLHTDIGKANFYLKDGSVYSGNYHVHINAGKFMTGSYHDENSVALYAKYKNTLWKTGTPFKETPMFKDRSKRVRKRRR